MVGKETLILQQFLPLSLHAELGSGLIARDARLPRWAERGAANSQRAPPSDPGIALRM